MQIFCTRFTHAHTHTHFGSFIVTWGNIIVSGKSKKTRTKFTIDKTIEDNVMYDEIYANAWLMIFFTNLKRALSLKLQRKRDRENTPKHQFNKVENNIILCVTYCGKLFTGGTTMVYLNLRYE